MVTIVHWYNRFLLKPSEVQCFVDGKLVSSEHLPFPHTPANEVSISVFLEKLLHQTCMAMVLVVF